MTRRAFVLIEDYRTPDDQLRHRETGHYLKWRDAVAELDGRAAHAAQIHKRIPG